jgi:regulator of protease activity HflC (stomatin/prohibitin superfamily)
VPDLVFGVANVEAGVHHAAEGAFREAVGRTPLETILVGGRQQFEEEIRDQLQERLDDEGVHVAVERVRIVDAHPPREVVPAYRDVSAAISDVARYRNDAEAFAAERKWSAVAEAQAKRDEAGTDAHRLQTRAEGDRLAFLARQQAHAARPDLTEFRLLWDALATSYAGRSKLILDPRASGRRHVWLADPERFGLGRAAGAEPTDFDGDTVED